MIMKKKLVYDRRSKCIGPVCITVGFNLHNLEIRVCTVECILPFVLLHSVKIIFIYYNKLVKPPEYNILSWAHYGRCGGLMVSMRIKWSGFEPWLQSLCCVLGKTFHSHSASLHPVI